VVVIGVGLPNETNDDVDDKFDSDCGEYGNGGRKFDAVE
jgi:hypothetical protein